MHEMEEAEGKDGPRYNADHAARILLREYVSKHPEINLRTHPERLFVAVYGDMQRAGFNIYQIGAAVSGDLKAIQLTERD